MAYKYFQLQAKELINEALRTVPNKCAENVCMEGLYSIYNNFNLFFGVIIRPVLHIYGFDIVIAKETDNSGYLALGGSSTYYEVDFRDYNSRISGYHKLGIDVYHLNNHIQIAAALHLDLFKELDLFEENRLGLSREGKNMIKLLCDPLAFFGGIDTKGLIDLGFYEKVINSNVDYCTRIVWFVRCACEGNLIVDIMCKIQGTIMELLMRT